MSKKKDQRDFTSSKSKPSVIGCIFSKDRKKVLLIKRRDVPVWVLPGGGMHAEEHPEDAIIREIQEETGFKTKINKKIGTYIPINRLANLTYLYVCSIIKGIPSIGEETKDIAFFDLNALPKLLPPPYEAWIKDALQDLPYPIQRHLNEINYFILIKNLFLHPHLVVRFLLSKIGLAINT